MSNEDIKSSGKEPHVPETWKATMRESSSNPVGTSRFTVEVNVFPFSISMRIG